AAFPAQAGLPTTALNNGGLTPNLLPSTGSVLRDAGITANILPPYDQRGVGFDRTLNNTADIGAVESTHATPTGRLMPVPAITAAGATPNSFQVVWFDSDSNLNLTTLNQDDVTLLDPSGAAITITGATVEPSSTTSSATVTYTFNPPGGS